MDVVTAPILETIKDIEFGCDFVDDECAAMRKREANRTHRTKSKGKICCRACAHNVGYLKIKSADLPDEHLKFWDPRLGFWRGGVGCTLPREIRSRRCNIYTCRDSNISDADRATLLHLEATT